MAAAALVVVVCFLFPWDQGVFAECARAEPAVPAEPEGADASGDGETAAEPRESAMGSTEVGTQRAGGSVAEFRFALVGRVIDASTSAPIPGAEVKVLRTRDPEEWMYRSSNEPAPPIPPVSTDAAGRFFLVCEPTLLGSDLVVTKPGLAPAWVDLGDALSRVYANLFQGVECSVGDVLVHRGVPIRGHVVAADGVSLVSDARISLGVRANAVRFEQLGFAKSDGYFAFPRQVVPDATRLLVAKSSLGTGWTRLDTVRDGEEIVVRLRPEANLRLTVTDQTGAPVPGAIVRILAPQAAFQDRLDTTDGKELGPQLEASASTAADGVANLSSITLGDDQGSGGQRTLQVNAKEHRMVQRTVVLQSGDNELSVVLVRGSCATLRGTVVSAVDGQPIAGASVGGSHQTNAAGEFVLPDVDCSEALPWLVVQAPGCMDGEARIALDGTAGDLEVRLALQPGAPAEGVLCDQEGVPFREFPIYLRDNPRIMVCTGWEGNFRFQALPLGPLTLRIVRRSLTHAFDEPVDLFVPESERMRIRWTVERRR